LKQVQYNWKDTNMALFGSDVEKKIKHEASKTESAWEGTGQKVELRVWRVNDFHVEKWTQIGSFFEGDSYILLNTYKNEGEDELRMDIHFWIGSYSSQDEYAVAAYKTVELDDFHNGVAVQHREVEKFESDLFKSYFPHITYLKGGCESGFHHVGPVLYQPRLFQITTGCTRTKTEIHEVPCCKAAVNDSDSWIYDAGLTFYLFHGSSANMHERNEANLYSRQLENERHGKARVEVVDEIVSKLPDGSHKEEKLELYSKVDEVLFKLVNVNGEGTLQLLESQNLRRSVLNTEDIFFIDNKVHLYIWVGKNAPHVEKKESFMTATKFLASSDHHLARISIFKEGREDQRFWSLFDE